MFAALLIGSVRAGGQRIGGEKKKKKGHKILFPMVTFVLLLSFLVLVAQVTMAKWRVT